MKRFLFFVAALSLIGCSTSSGQQTQADTPQSNDEVSHSESEKLTSTQDSVYVTLGDAGIKCGKSREEQNSTSLDQCIIEDTEVVELFIDTTHAWERVIEEVGRLASRVQRVTVTDNLGRSTLLSTTTPSDLQEHIVIHYDDRGVKAACLTTDEPGFYPADLPALNVGTPIIAEALDGVPCDGATWIGVYCEGTLEADGCMRVLEAATEAYSQPIVLIDSNPS